MISLANFKVLLGNFGQKLTDKQIEHLHTIEYQLADAILEQWLRKRKRYAQKGLEITSEKNTIVSEHNISPEVFLLPEPSDIERG